VYVVIFNTNLVYGYKGSSKSWVVSWQQNISGSMSEQAWLYSTTQYELNVNMQEHSLSCFVSSRRCFYNLTQRVDNFLWCIHYCEPLLCFKIN